MRKSSLKQSIALATLLGASLSPLAAQAQMAVYDTGDPTVVAAVNSNTASNAAAITAQTTALVTALQLLSGQLTANNQATINGSGNIATT